MRPKQIGFKLIIVATLLLTACAAGLSSEDTAQVDVAPSAAEINAAAERAAVEGEPTLQPSETGSPAALPAESSPTSPPEATETPAEDEITAGNPLTNLRVEVPDNLRVNWLLPWDAIRPVYNPEFATAEENPLDDEELVLGISLGGEAKAYPITVLNHREMVNDEMAGIPTLVTW